jgi:hypothetical protein
VNKERTNGDDTDCLVRLWVVVEEDRGMGATVQSCHVSEDKAFKELSGSKSVDWVDIPWSQLELLRPNGKVSVMNEAKRNECTSPTPCSHVVSLSIQAFALLPSQARKSIADTHYQEWAVSADRRISELQAEINGLKKQKEGLFGSLLAAKKTFYSANAEAHGRHSRTVQPLVGNSNTEDRR